MGLYVGMFSWYLFRLDWRILQTMNSRGENNLNRLD